MAENCKKALLIGYEDIVEVDVEGLDDLQRLVGGYIDVVDLPLFGEDVQASLYVNDEGIYTHSPNRAIAATAELEEDGYLSAVKAYFSHPASMPGSGWLAYEQVARLEAQGGLR